MTLEKGIWTKNLGFCAYRESLAGGMFLCTKEGKRGAITRQACVRCLEERRKK